MILEVTKALYVIILCLYLLFTQMRNFNSKCTDLIFNISKLNTKKLA